ncbi:MAG: EAL domain-containing protein [Lachnospiraceae bacterium]|nr:EAL domain-containing protein [Lachnospiraceae bacterium]
METKSKGGDGVIYVENLNKQSLKDYIDQGEFEMYLQPQYSIVKNTIIGAEALTRWKHKDMYISPGEFIPVLERKNLISILDRYIWTCAFRLQEKKRREGQQIIPISINVSRSDFSHLDVYGVLTELSRTYCVPPEDIHLEITETAFVEDKQAIYTAVRDLKRLGFQILIDDFGSGYSALNTLKDIDADIVKLDMKFFDLNEKNSMRARDIIGAVIQMTQSLGMGIIAEGVENAEQLDILKEFGCDVIQGYFFYRPMNVSDFDMTMRRVLDTASRKNIDSRAFGEECLDESIRLLERGEYESALSLAKRALSQISVDFDGNLYCNMENIIGAIYTAMGNEMMGMEHYLTGLSVSLKVDNSAVSGKLYNNIGCVYQALGDPQQAIKYFLLAMEELKRPENKKEDLYEQRCFISNINLADEYFKLGAFEESEHYLNRAAELVDNSANEDYYLTYRAAQCKLYLQTGREDFVREIFPDVVDMAMNIRDWSEFWSYLEPVCDIALALNEMDEMKRIIQRMEQQADLYSVEQLGLEIRIRIHEKLLVYYENIGDSEKARQTEFEYFRLCKMQYQEMKKARVEAINYKIQLNLQHEENAKFKKQIDIDQLTGVGNRYKLEKDYKMIKGICSERKCPVGIGIIDLDNFKYINDTYGHLQGDWYLKTASRIIKEAVVNTGGVYRFGGDEFVVLLVDVQEDVIDQMATEIERKVEEECLLNQSAERKALTLSQGYVILDHIENTDVWQMIPYADEQLYAVKEHGKRGHRIKKL